jgi:hypothetical protein
MFWSGERRSMSATDVIVVDTRRLPTSKSLHRTANCCFFLGSDLVILKLLVVFGIFCSVAATIVYKSLSDYQDQELNELDFGTIFANV